MELNTEFVGREILRQNERSERPPSENHHKVTESTCDCKCFTNTHLPCAHIFRFRRTEGTVCLLSLVYDFYYLLRWYEHSTHGNFILFQRWKFITMA